MKTVSIISIVYGTLGLIWAGVITLLIKLQKALFADFPFPDEVYEYMDITAVLDGTFDLMATLTPFIYIISLVFILSGIMQLAGNSSFKIFIYIAAILNIVWYVSYVVLVQVEIVPLMGMLEMIPKGLVNAMFIFGGLINIGLYCGYPIFLLFYMRKGREWDTLDTGYQN